MPKVFTRAEDEELLNILHLRDNVGLTASAVSKRCGRSRAAILGLEHRIRQDALSCICAKPENQDGGMPALWWRT